MYPEGIAEEISITTSLSIHKEMFEEILKKYAQVSE